MPEDLRPAPRLPLDTAEVISLRHDGMATPLGYMLVSEPAEDIFHVSLLQSYTPQHWPAGWERRFHNFEVQHIFIGQEAAETEAKITLENFGVFP